MKTQPLSSRLAVPLDCALLAAITAWMILPLFTLQYTDRWVSTEAAYISDARFLAAHFPHPRWQPNWYAGSRFDYFFPPLVRYATAVLAKVFHLVRWQAYHLCCAFFYCLGIVSVYLMLRACAGSRVRAWLGALFTLLLSPVLIFIPSLYVGGWHRAPQRIALLTQWGEGFHMAALALIPLALACAYLAFERHRPAAIAGAAFFAAAVVSCDWSGAAALLIFFAMLLWSFWITHQEKAVFGRAATIVLLTWGLTAFWLVPSTLRVTRENLRLLAQPSTTWSVWMALAAIVGYLLVSDRLARGRRERVWPVFILGSAALVGLYVLAGEYAGFRLAGNPVRLVAEFELVLVLAAVTLARGPRIVIAGLAVVALASAAPYVRRHNVFFPRDVHVEQRPEYRIQYWISLNMPDARTMVAGSVRQWYDMWNDLPQLGGGADQTVNNPLAVAAGWQVLLSDNADLSIEWMRAMGVEAIVVNGEGSQEMYHEFHFPEKFAGKLPVLFDNHQGDKILGVPHRFAGIAHVVDRARLEAIASFGRDVDTAHLHAYTDAVEEGQPADLKWQSNEAFVVRAALKPGQALLVQESWDPAWRASAGGQAVPLRRDPMGFLLAAAPPGDHALEFTFALPLENIAGSIITLAALGVLARLCFTSVGVHASR